MAVAGEIVVPGNVMDFTRTPGGRKIMLMLGVAAVAAVMAAVWMWGQQPDYRVLFSNFIDRDGGAIVAELEKMNIPYQYAEGGGAVLVPADRVHDARLKLASQGLPKRGNVGFELMENQKLGSSQFVEQINFQRAIEGELARSIESVSAVQAARVHLAMPKDSIFLSEQKAPTASVLLNLHPGRVHRLEKARQHRPCVRDQDLQAPVARRRTHHAADGPGRGGACLQVYIKYHDEEWGTPVHDDKRLFELLTLEGFQAGLTWELILKRRTALKGAFADFYPEKVAKYTETQIHETLTNPQVIPNKAKIQAAVGNAQRFLAIQSEFGSFNVFIWRFVKGKPIDHRLKSMKEMPAQTEESRAMSIELKKRGFKFEGPTICYAFMQAVGMVNDHLTSCFRYKQIDRESTTWA